jgi:hypothetical protein
MKSEQIDKLAQALSKAQSQLQGARKDATNPHFRSKFADLESVWDAVREPLVTNGLAITQTTDVRAGVAGLVTTLMHTSGQWIEGFLPLNAVKPDPQAQGSSITYARRYALSAIMGVIQVDDDGEAAMDRPTSPAAQPLQNVRQVPARGNGARPQQGGDL